MRRSARHLVIPSRRLRILAGLLCLTLALPIAAQSETQLRSLQSPDGRLKLVIETPSAGTPVWAAAFREKSFLTNCELSLKVQEREGGDLVRGRRVVAERSRSVDQIVPVLFGKTEWARDRFNETHLTFQSKNGLRTEVVFRCYNDAIAFRYEVAADSGNASVLIADEKSTFQLAGGPQSYVQYLKNYKTSHEHNVVLTPYHEIQPGALLDLPLTFSWTDGTYAAITEAALRQYAGMALMRDGNSDTLVTKLTPRADGAKAARELPMKTPWRVFLIGDRPGTLLESTVIYCLNEPNATGDTSWIKPGKLTFHWWNGDVYDGRPGVSILSYDIAKKYIDFCASNQIAFHGLSSTEGTTTPWYWQSAPGVEPGPDTDVTKPRPGFELERIKTYADSKGVRLWTWVHQRALRGKVDEAFAAFEKMGWSGMMVDFFDHDDQDHVEFAEEILKAAAKRRILIHLHGVWKPTGLERTYPNLMNHEGALNLEYLKWSDLCTPEHDLRMAFTRLIAGPMDYHLGGFRAVRRADFKARQIAPNVLGTRGHQLAMFVCFDNPSPMLADYPTAYIGQPGFDFLQVVPTWWDETRVLAGEVGTLLVTARRKGGEWFIGGLAAGEPREVEVPLPFLGSVQYSATVWKDAANADTDPNALSVQRVSPLTVNDRLKVKVAADGGFVARLSPFGETR